MKKVAILTWLNNCNYGSILQAYALQSYIKSLGYDVEEVLVPFNRDLTLKSIDNSTMPYKDTINKFISRR